MTLKPFVSFFLMLFSSTLMLQSQPNWFPENAEWYYHPHCFSEPDCGFAKYFTDGDTLIGEISAKVVRFQYQNFVDPQDIPASSHYFYNSNDTVFYYSVLNETWSLLYDFSAQPGDVWDLTEIFEFDDMVAKIYVDTVITEMLGGLMRRVIYTSPLFDDEEMGLMSDWEFLGPIVEGIGPVGMSSGLFGEGVAQLPAGWPPYFSCYRESNTVVYGSGEYPCGVVSNIEENAPISFSVFPNPTASLVNIEPPQHVEFPELLRLYNIMGQQVKTYPVTQFPLTLNLGDLPAGMYVLEGETSSGARMTSRIVKALE